MFDFTQYELAVKEHFFKLFRRYNKKDETNYFIRRWLEVVYSHIHLKGFLGFDPKFPLLNYLKPDAKAVVMIYSNSTTITYPKLLKLPRYISIYAYCPFRIRQKHTDTLCQIGLEFFLQYLSITDIQLVCIYQMNHLENLIMDELKEKHPNLKIYTTKSLDCFCLMAKNVIFETHDLKYQSHSSTVEDKVSQQEGL